jgi:hypothetical protein
MWLLEKLTPDDKTISNFRKDNAAALKRVFREFSVWCSRNGLYGKELIGVDGSKIRANSSRKNIHTQKGTSKALALVEKKIAKYMAELEENDSAEADEEKLPPEVIVEILQNLNGKKERLEDWQKKIEANGGKEISTVDPDAHMMYQSGDGRPLDACYNVQSAVDAKHKLIVDFDVSTCADDTGSLPVVTESAKAIMGVDTICAAADKGYYNGEDIDVCEKNGTSCYVAIAETKTHAPDANYHKKYFKYDAEKDCYICPAGKELPYRHLAKGNKVYSSRQACKKCPHREKCTTDKRGRSVVRSQYQDVLNVHDARMLTEKGRSISRRRKEIVEHPFGTTKHIWGYRQFLCRGQEKTTAEQSLTFLAYNFLRVFNIFKENRESLLEKMAG